MKMVNKKYLIEYELNYNNMQPIGEDNVFSGEGVFYVRAVNLREAKKKSRKMIKLLKRSYKIKLTRTEEAYA